MKKINYFGYKIYAPDWAMYIATDVNGDGWLYTRKPIFDIEQKKWVNMDSMLATKVKQTIDLPIPSENSLKNIEEIVIDDDSVVGEAAEIGQHYKFSYKGIKLDPYRIFDVYGIKSAPQQHAIKKLLRAGNSVKDLKRDISEVVATLERWLEMIDEDL